MPKRTGCSRGFTLVELITTILIIALIAAVSGPRFFDINVFQQQGFYDETIAAIRYAQKYAVATGCTVRVQITAGGYTLFRPAGVATCNTGPYNIAIADPSGNEAAFARTTPGDITLTTNPVTPNIDFIADGSAAVPATVVVNVGTTQSFQVIPATGFVQRCVNFGCP